MSDLTIEEQCIPKKCKDDLVSRREVYKFLLACKTGWDFSQALMNMPSVEPEIKSINVNLTLNAEQMDYILEQTRKQLPTKRKIGKWHILDECANKGVYCSECRKKVFKIDFSSTMKWKNFRYCPNCGAEMEG